MTTSDSFSPAFEAGLDSSRIGFGEEELTSVIGSFNHDEGHLFGHFCLEGPAPQRLNDRPP